MRKKKQETNTKKRLTEKRVEELRTTQTMDPDGELREIRKEGVAVQKRFKFPLFYLLRYVWLFIWLPLRSGSLGSTHDPDILPRPLLSFFMARSG